MSSLPRMPRRRLDRAGGSLGDFFHFGGDAASGAPAGPATVASLLQAILAAESAVPPTGIVPADQVRSSLLASMTGEGLTLASFDALMAASSRATNPDRICSILTYPSLTSLCGAARDAVLQAMKAPPPAPGPEQPFDFDLNPVALQTQMGAGFTDLQAWRTALRTQSLGVALADPVALAQIRTVIDAFLPVEGLKLCPNGYVFASPRRDPATQAEAFGFLAPLISPVQIMGRDAYYLPDAQGNWPTGDCITLDTRQAAPPVNPTWWKSYFSTLAAAFQKRGEGAAANAVRTVANKADQVLPKADVIGGSGIFWQALWVYRSLRDALWAPLLASFDAQVTSILVASALRLQRPTMTAIEALAAAIAPNLAKGTFDNGQTMARTAALQMVAQLGTKVPGEIAQAFVASHPATGSSFPTGKTGTGTGTGTGFPLITDYPKDTGFPISTDKPKDPVKDQVVKPGDETQAQGQGLARWPLNSNGVRKPIGKIPGHPGLLTRLPPAKTTGGTDPVDASPPPVKTEPPVVAPPVTTTAAPEGHPVLVAAGIVAGLAGLAAGTVALVRVSQGKPALPASLSDPLGK